MSRSFSLGRRRALVVVTASMILGSIWGVSTASAATIEPGFGLPHLMSLEVTATGVTVKLSCAGTSAQTCAGTIIASTAETLQGKKVASVSTKHAPKRREVAVRVAQASFSLAGGTSATVPVKLNSTGMALLRRFHAMSATVLAAETIPSGRFFFLVRDVRFKEPKKKHKKHH